MRIYCAPPALTTRTMVEADFEQIAQFLHEAAQIAIKIQDQSGPKLKDFLPLLENNPEIEALKTKVHEFATKFPMPGFDPKSMKYQDPQGPPGH